jgi:predicted glutamine amidotransferase
MCRLLGYVARSGTTVMDVVGRDEFEHFRHLARTHSDGWGAAWRADGDRGGGRVAARVSVEAADDSRDFRAFAETHRADTAIVHLRRGTQGLAVCEANTHPFTVCDTAFAHNGSVIPPESLDALIPAGFEAPRRGDTDSERLHLAIAARMWGEPRLSARDAVTATLRAVDERLEYTSLNCMLLTPDQLVVASLFRPDMVRAYATFELAPDYYEMRYRISGDAVIASSSGWPQDGWTRLRNGEVLVVDRATLSATVSQVHPANGAA